MKTAQEQWKEFYRVLTIKNKIRFFSWIDKMFIRSEMKRLAREAALERALDAANKKISIIRAKNSRILDDSEKMFEALCIARDFLDNWDLSAIPLYKIPEAIDMYKSRNGLL